MTLINFALVYHGGKLLTNARCPLSIFDIGQFVWNISGVGYAPMFRFMCVIILNTGACWGGSSTSVITRFRVRYRLSPLILG
jgi:hypothetical protein